MKESPSLLLFPKIKPTEDMEVCLLKRINVTVEVYLRTHKKKEDLSQTEEDPF